MITLTLGPMMTPTPTPNSGGISNFGGSHGSNPALVAGATPPGAQAPPSEAKPSVKVTVNAAPDSGIFSSIVFYLAGFILL
jgi:hypothetical protein